MTTTIDLDIDAYGTYARATCLADFLEVLALQGRHMTRAELADVVKDSGWEGLGTSVIGGASYEPPDDWTEAAFEMLEQRAELLGSRYPFKVKANTVEFLETDSVYEGFLALTVAHSVGVKAPNPAVVLEASVYLSLVALGLTTVEFGGISRGAANFEAALDEAGRRLGIPTNVSSGAYRINAQDEGVDTLGLFLADDTRRGRWSFIGQVTCAKSDQWKRKLDEPHPVRWSKFLLDPIHPLVFLAVPHHVEPQYLDYLLDSGKLTMDRLRLSNVDRKLSTDETTLTSIVKNLTHEF